MLGGNRRRAARIELLQPRTELREMDSGQRPLVGQTALAEDARGRPPVRAA